MAGCCWDVKLVVQLRVKLCVACSDFTFLTCKDADALRKHIHVRVLSGKCPALLNISRTGHVALM
jgi:hypothetical protein